MIDYTTAWRYLYTVCERAGGIRRIECFWERISGELRRRVMRSEYALSNTQDSPIVGTERVQTGQYESKSV